MEVALTSRKKCVNLAVVFRPPPSRKNGLKVADLLKDFGEFIDLLKGPKGQPCYLR